MFSTRAVEVENHREHQLDIGTPGGALCATNLSHIETITENLKKKKYSGVMDGINQPQEWHR